jgi:hypothetical protein
MLHLFLDGRPWFRAKSHGYGAGLPIAWQGWAMLAAHIALIMGLVTLLRDRPAALVSFVILAALMPMPLYRARTEGGWHWRWGNRAEQKRGRKGRRK